MSNRLIRSAFAAALFAVLGAGAQASAATTIHSGSLYATKTGTAKDAVILIPGLGCGAWVWDDTVKALAKDHTVYAVTLAGFDGTPPVAGPTRFNGYADSVIALIRSEHLERPVVVGHSMGGEIGLRVAAEAPDLVGGLVIVDSLPMFPPLRAGETMDDRKAAFAKVVAGLKAQSDADYAATESKAASQLVTNPDLAQTVTTQVLKSDRATVADSLYELSTTDLHPELSKITAPVLVLAAGDNGYPTAATTQFYTAQYAGTPHVTVTTIEHSRHFIMLDQPAAFEAALAGFLADRK